MLLFYNQLLSASHLEADNCFDNRTSVETNFIHMAQHQMKLWLYAKVIKNKKYLTTYYQILIFMLKITIMNNITLIYNFKVTNEHM